MSANLLRRWVVEEERVSEVGLLASGNASPGASLVGTGAFVPVEVTSPAVAALQEIVIELHRGATVVKVSWPVDAAAGCGGWLRELLR